MANEQQLGANVKAALCDWMVMPMVDVYFNPTWAIENQLPGVVLTPAFREADLY